MLSQLRPAITLIAIFTLLTGVLLPLGFVGFGKLVMPYQAGGSLIVQNGKVVGSEIIGPELCERQIFSRPPIRPDGHRSERQHQAGRNAV